LDDDDDGGDDADVDYVFCVYDKVRPHTCSNNLR
jgi:hypothetical protein